MKVKAHVVICNGHNLAVDASQDLGELLQRCEEYNAEHFGEDYLLNDKKQAVVTVEFEVDEVVFKRPPTPVIQGKIE
jgi:hypothetical protein